MNLAEISAKSPVLMRENTSAHQFDNQELFRVVRNAAES
jgi:hypothetical protein